MKRIGIYGGGFNPPHVGHVLAVQHALTFGNLDLVAVLPCWQHPFAKDSGLLPFNDRLEMTRRAFYNDARIRVDELESDFQVSYTVDLIEKLLEISKGSKEQVQFVLILGSDNIQDWEKWHRHEDLDKMVEKFVVPRAGSTSSPWVLPDISSTTIREWIQAGEWDKVETVVPPKVVDYIRVQGLWK